MASHLQKSPTPPKKEENLTSGDNQNLKNFQNKNNKIKTARQQRWYHLTNLLNSFSSLIITTNRLRMHRIPVFRIRPEPHLAGFMNSNPAGHEAVAVFVKCELQMQCGCRKSARTKLRTLALLICQCGKCTVTNVTVIIQFFRFQSNFKR